MEGNRDIDILALNHEKEKYLRNAVSVRLGPSFQLDYNTHKIDWDNIKDAANKHNIEILFLEEMLKELPSYLKNDKKNQRDEIIRTLQLVSRIIND